MEPGAAPDPDSAVVDFPPGSETRKGHLGNTNKVRIFWLFSSFSLQTCDVCRVFLRYLVLFVGPVGLPDAIDVKRSEELFGLE